MRNNQVALIQLYVIVKKYINVDGTVGIAAIHRLMRSSQVALYLLCGTKHLAGREPGTDKGAGVEKQMVALKAPRLCFQEARHALHRAHTLAKQGESGQKDLPAVAQIRAEGQIDLMRQGSNR